MKKGLFVFVILVITIGSAELVARYVLGLGDPPLVVADTECDYIMAPNQNCNRFGNRIIYNNISMRCDVDVFRGGVRCLLSEIL